MEFAHVEFEHRILRTVEFAHRKKIEKKINGGISAQVNMRTGKFEHKK